MTQPEKRLHQLPERSARARPELVYQWEKLAVILRELPPIFKRHWRQIALNQDKIPLDPDWRRYLDYDLLSILHVLTVRHNTVLVGYIFMFVHPHLHYASTMWAQTDIFWLDEAYREGTGAGLKMFRLLETRLKELGVKVVYLNAKLHFEAERGTIGKIFEWLGYKPTEMVYSKFLG